MIDKERIEELIKSLERRRGFLENYVGMPYEEFSSEERSLDYDAVLHNLQLALQSAIDIGKHILAAKLAETPKETKDIFSRLSEMKIIDRDLSEKLTRAAGLRNILVHSYTEVDQKKIYDHIQNDLTDLDRLVLAVDEFLKKEENITLGEIWPLQSPI